ncbi:tripartite tricarboxylate transporter substrate binding protein [Roseococcus sp.]|uniref:tripartite tricarboxylate transporter substrate binding protein n=1 Tax=Roseococcus sp. TaxID=2109646 RepID=UPI003BA97528
MKRTIRAALRAAFAATLLCASAKAQPAEEYPARPVQVIVSWQAGGLIDTVGRAFAQMLSDAAEGRFVVVNRDGGSGIVGAQALASARPDGYTIGFGPITPITTAAHTVRGVPFSIDSFDYVCKVFENVMGVTVAEASPLRSMAELVAAIRARPGELNYGHNGTNGLAHVYFANIVHALSLQVVDVAFRGEAGMFPEILSGRLHFGMGTLGGVRGRPLRMLAVFGDTRSGEAPEVPSTRELGLPTLQPVLAGVTVPRGTPAAVVERLSDLCRTATEATGFRAVMDRLGQPIAFLDRVAFSAQAHRDNAEKIEVVRALGLLPD